MLNPAFPPPPPTLCARMPLEPGPPVRIRPEFVTPTLLAPFAPPALPPIVIFDDSPVAPVAEIAKPPLPPPPPMLCAEMPFERSPRVTMVLELVTPTADAVPPVPPLPPIAMPRPQPGLIAPLIAKPPFPPPPPIDCASIPSDSAPGVYSAAAGFATGTACALPPAPPLVPMLWLRPFVGPVVLLNPAEISNAPLPPPPPIDCASSACDTSPFVGMLPEFVTVTLPPPPPPALAP